MRPPPALLPLAACCMMSAAALTVRANDPASVSVLDELVAQGQAHVVHSPDGVMIDGTATAKPQPVTATAKSQFAAPVVITAEVKLDANDLRLYFAKGFLNFSWFDHQDQMLYRDPATGKTFYKKHDGLIEPQKWHTIQWTITEKQYSATVDGTNRITCRGDYSGITGIPGIGTLSNSRITVRSLTVQGAPSQGPSTPGSTVSTSAPTSNGSVPIATSTPRPASIDPGTSTPEPAILPDAIEQPAYRKRAKQLVKDLASVNGLVVRTQADGSEVGSTLDFIAVVPGDSRQTPGSKVLFVRGGQGEQMQTSFDEAVRAVKLRFPWWADGRIEVSFDDKYSSKDGGSGGCTFGVLLLSLLQGYDIDPAFAMTGDITVDWKVQKVGGVPWKILGAIAGNCSCVAIPKANAEDVNDLRLLTGDANLWKAQIFSIATLQDAVALARTDRAPTTVEAMKAFADLVPQLTKSEKMALATPSVHKALEHIVALVPNHLSASLLLQVADHTAPATLSEEATIQRLQIIRYPYLQLLESNRTIDRVSLPAVVTVDTQKKINALRLIADKKFLPFLMEYSRYAQFMDDIATGHATAAKAKERAEAIASQFAALRQQ